MRSLFEAPMRISIVTLALDFPEYLDEAVRSIPRDSPFELEHLVVHDGDESSRSEIERRYPHIAVLKGDGTGATSAAVRAIEAATGDFILLLNSDDRLAPDAFNRLAVCAEARPDVRIWTGGVRIFRVLADGSEDTVRLLLSRDLTDMSLANVCDDIPLLTARFCHRSVYADIGNFDPAYSECSDREFLFRAIMAGITDAPLDVLVSELRLHGGSRTIHRRRGWVPPYLAEHLRIAEAWLKRADLATGVSRFLRNWRARELLRLMIYQCRSGQWRTAAGLLCHTEMSDPLWIFRATSAFAAVRRRSRGDDPSLLNVSPARRAGRERIV
jgi:glycosyltransferase involved in cell wall biosynthesis